MLLLAMPRHAYMYHTTGKKGLLGAPCYGVSTHCFSKAPQWNFPTLLESITHEKSVCLLLLHSKLEFHSLTRFSSESGTDTHRHTPAYFANPMSWPCIECYNSSTLLKTWWASWNITYLRYQCKPLSCFNEAEVIFVWVTQLKELIVGAGAKLQGSVFPLMRFHAISAAERLNSLQAIVSIPPP